MRIKWRLRRVAIIQDTATSFELRANFSSKADHWQTLCLTTQLRFALKVTTILFKEFS